jgi:hypothetical protein
VLPTARKKEVENTVAQKLDKPYSWAEVKQLYGTQRFLMGMAKDANSLYLQQLGDTVHLGTTSGAQ